VHPQNSRECHEPGGNGHVFVAMRSARRPTWPRKETGGHAAPGTRKIEGTHPRSAASYSETGLL